MTGSNALYSPSSLLCRHALSSTIIASSRDAGWTSGLIELHRVTPCGDVFETRSTPDQTIVVMTHGEQVLQSFVGGTWRQATYRAGTIGMTPGGMSDRLRRRVPRRPAPFEKANLYIPQRLFGDAVDHYRRAGSPWRQSPLTALAFDDPVIAHTVFSLLRAMRAGATDLYAQAALQWLAVHLLAVHSPWLDLDADCRDAGIITDKRLARVVGYMGEHFAEPLTLEDLAAEAGVSKFHFARLFRETMGAAPHAFLMRLRLATARRLLSTSDLRVAEIASRCGFPRSAHFGTAFVKRFGVSPTAFRRRSRH